MKIIIIILLLLILYCFLFKNNYENMHDYTGINTSNKCCVINKKFNANNKVEYTYKVSNNCEGMYDNNTRTIKEGDVIDGKPYSLDSCNKEKSNLGSCRNIGFECVDFITKKDCDLQGMTWSKLTCQEQLPITIKYPSFDNKYVIVK